MEQNWPEHQPANTGTQAAAATLASCAKRCVEHPGQDQQHLLSGQLDQELCNRNVTTKVRGANKCQSPWRDNASATALCAREAEHPAPDEQPCKQNLRPLILQHQSADPGASACQPAQENWLRSPFRCHSPNMTLESPPKPRLLVINSTWTCMPWTERTGLALSRVTRHCQGCSRLSYHAQKPRSYCYCRSSQLLSPTPDLSMYPPGASQDLSIGARVHPPSKQTLEEGGDGQPEATEISQEESDFGYDPFQHGLAPQEQLRDDTRQHLPKCE